MRSCLKGFPSLERLLNDLSVTQGSTVSLKCPICPESAVPHLTVTWYKDGSPTPSYTGLMWVIRSAQKQDEGRYHCKVFHSGQAILSNTVKVTVEGMEGTGISLEYTYDDHLLSLSYMQEFRSSLV